MPPSLSRLMLPVLLATALLIASCAGNQYPTTPPDPRNPNLTWAEKHYIQKMRYQQMTRDRLR